LTSPDPRARAAARRWADDITRQEQQDRIVAWRIDGIMAGTSRMSREDIDADIEQVRQFYRHLSELITRAESGR
jgi:hypothetical protein